jgi:hypothetical protein
VTCFCQPETPVDSCGEPTGLDSGDPRSRRKMDSTAIDPTARNSDCSRAAAVSSVAPANDQGEDDANRDEHEIAGEDHPLGPHVSCPALGSRTVGPRGVCTTRYDPPPAVVAGQEERFLGGAHLRLVTPHLSGRGPTRGRQALAQSGKPSAGRTHPGMAGMPRRLPGNLSAIPAGCAPRHVAAAPLPPKWDISAPTRT